MRLSDFENEEALDLLADLIEPASVVMTDPEVKKMAQAKKPPLVIASYILRHHKKSAIEIVAAIHREDVSKCKFNAISVLNDLLDILNDPEIEAVFTSQGQTTASTSSGSATENTTEKGH